MSKYYPGFGTTRPLNIVDRQKELQELMERREKAEERLNENIIKKLYVEPKGGTKEGAPNAR